MVPFARLRCNFASFLMHTDAFKTSQACLQGEVISLLLKFY